MKLNIFATILLTLGLNITILANEGTNTGGGSGGSNGCHGDFVSSEFNQR